MHSVTLLFELFTLLLYSLFLSFHSLIGFTSSLYITMVVIVKYALIDDDYLNCMKEIENRK